jgi:hypothetical protein
MDTSVVDTTVDWYFRFCFRQMPEYYLSTKLAAEVETILMSTSLFAQKEQVIAIQKVTLRFE